MTAPPSSYAGRGHLARRYRLQHAFALALPGVATGGGREAGSFKDRGSVMLSFLRQIGIDAVLEDSSGNGGSSIAGFGAAGGAGVERRADRSANRFPPHVSPDPPSVESSTKKNSFGICGVAQDG
jgi:hypothetical protein